MDEFLGYILAWILDRIVPSLRVAWGNLGCLLASILAAGVLVFWFLPAYVLDEPGGDWKTWLIVGPLAAFAVVVMVAGTYGLARGSRSKKDEIAVGESDGDQEPAKWSIMEPPVRDSKASFRATPQAMVQSVQTGTKECPHCGAQVSSRAITCRHCNEWLMDRPYAVKAAEKKPAQELVQALRNGRPRGLVWALGLAGLCGLATLALPFAALATRVKACGPLHSSVFIFALLTLAICLPVVALPAALVWIMGRRRPDGSGADAKDFSFLRGLTGGILGLIISFAANAVCAVMIFFPECL